MKMVQVAVQVDLSLVCVCVVGQACFLSILLNCGDQKRVRRSKQKKTRKTAGSTKIGHLRRLDRNAALFWLMHEQRFCWNILFCIN